MNNNRIGNIILGNATKYALQKNYNKVWECKTVQEIVNNTARCAYYKLIKLDNNITIEDVKADLYIKMVELVNRYNPILQSGDVISFEGLLISVFKHYKTDTRLFTFTNGAKLSIDKNTNTYYKKVDTFTAINPDYTTAEMVDFYTNCEDDFDSNLNASTLIDIINKFPQRIAKVLHTLIDPNNADATYIELDKKMGKSYQYSSRLFRELRSLYNLQDISNTNKKKQKQIKEALEELYNYLIIR